MGVWICLRSTAENLAHSNVMLRLPVRTSSTVLDWYSGGEDEDESAARPRRSTGQLAHLPTGIHRLST